MIRFKTFIENYTPPKLKVGDEVKVGKWKNRKAVIKGFTKDKHNQPVLKTNKGDQKLFKPRISKLEETVQLNELFDKPYPWKWKNKSPNHWNAEARLPDGKQLMVYITQPNPSGKVGCWEVQFRKNLELDATGEGDQFKIFATVISVINTWWELRNDKVKGFRVRELEFSADKESSKTDGRTALYNRFAKQFAKKTNMYLEVTKNGSATFYTLKQRKKKK